jgi:plasmid maintenance system antidote protein VapI
MVVHIGDFLKECIDNQGLKQTQVAPIYGTTVQNLNKVLGKEDVSTEILRKFEKVLGVEFEIKMSRVGVVDITQYNATNKGRKPSYKNGDLTADLSNEELESLKVKVKNLEELLQVKEELIRTKDELIALLKSK